MTSVDLSYTLADIQGMSYGQCEERLTYLRYLKHRTTDQNKLEAYAIYIRFLEARQKEVKSASSDLA